MEKSRVQGISRVEKVKVAEKIVLEIRTRVRSAAVQLPTLRAIAVNSILLTVGTTSVTPPKKALLWKVPKARRLENNPSRPRPARRAKKVRLSRGEVASRMRVSEGEIPTL